MKRKVLIVDDSVINRDILESILSNDYDLLMAENGEEALAILNESAASISAVLLDLMMPVMDGYQVLFVMRKDPVLTKIPVLVMTGRSEEEAEVRVLSEGAKDFIAKPYNREVIKHRLRNTITLRETAAMINAVERDDLTDLYSKNFFYHNIQNLLHTTTAISYDMICFDIIRFHMINELFGEKIGDDLLVYIAENIIPMFGENAVSGRIGGDNFAILVPHRNNYDEDYFKPMINELTDFSIPIHIRLAFGIYPVDDLNVPVSLMCDRALSAAESVKGKYGVAFACYDDSIRQKALNEQFILDSMQQGINERQFEVYYQPKVDLVTKKVIGAEALVRWIHPARGFMSPGSFIPIFEQNGFISRLDEYVWEQTCSDMSKWMKQGHAPFPISVNVSRADIFNPSLPNVLDRLLEKYEIPSYLLHLEITETAYTEDTEQLIEMVTSLKSKGFDIEMDDFGAGYSSLNMLEQLPISILKLDMGFVRSLNLEKAKGSTMDFVIRLANHRGFPVIAEGVETEEQAVVLRDLGCEFAQGYLFAKPMKVTDFEAFVHASR